MSRQISVTTSSMVPLELISMAVGGLGGFIMKYMAQKAQDEKERFERMLNTIKAIDESADRAVRRVPNDKAGNWTRRFIVISIVFGVILAPFFLAMLGKPVIVQIDVPVKTWFLGLFVTGGKPLFYQVSSYLLIPEVRTSLTALVGFYFGQAAAKRS